MTVDAERARRPQDMYRNNATDKTLDEGSDDKYNEQEDLIVSPNYLPEHSANPSLAPQSNVPAGAATTRRKAIKANTPVIT